MLPRLLLLLPLPLLLRRPILCVLLRLLLLLLIPLLELLLGQLRRCCCVALLLWLLGLLPLLLRPLLLELPHVVRLLLRLLHRLHAHRPLSRARTVSRVWGHETALIGAVAARPLAAWVHFPVVDLLLGVVAALGLKVACLAQVRRALCHPADAIRLLALVAQLAPAGVPRAVP